MAETILEKVQQKIKGNSESERESRVIQSIVEGFSDLEYELGECAGVSELIAAHIVGCTHPKSEGLILSGLNMLTRRLEEMANYYHIEELECLIRQDGGKV